MPSLELPSENGPLATPLNPPRAFFCLFASRLAARSASASLLLSAATCSLVLSRSRAACSFAMASRSSLLLRPVNAGVLTPLLPRAVPPRPRTEGDADREGGTEPCRLPNRWTGARALGSAPGWGDSTAAEGGAYESTDTTVLSPLTAGFDSLSSCLGTTGSAASPVAAAGAVLCGVASSTDSRAAAVSLAAVDPPLAPPRARVLPPPLGFGGIAVVVV